jgi:hypothetical protein
MASVGIPSAEAGGLSDLKPTVLHPAEARACLFHDAVRCAKPHGKHAAA